MRSRLSKREREILAEIQERLPPGFHEERRREMQERWKALRTSDVPAWKAMYGIPEERSGHVYFVEAIGSDRIKIGFTTKFERRMKALRTGCPFPIVLLHSEPGTLRDERATHRRFATSVAVPGSEWFHATPELRAYVKERMASS